MAKFFLTQMMLLQTMTDVSEAVSCAIQQNQSYGRRHEVTKYLGDISGKATSWENAVLECQMYLAPTAAV